MIRAAAAALARGETTARRLVDERLARIDPAQNIFAEVFADQARTAADRFDAGRRTGRLLDGLPLAHKDIFCLPGRQPGCGLQPGRLALDLPPSRAAANVGGITLGMVNLAEYALGTTGTNHFLGDVANPRAPGHITGASSSGSGAVIAAGLAFGSLGTDSGGSIRLPAGFCGVVGLKPTAGAVPAEGIFPLSWSLDEVGPMAATVDDCAILFAAAKGETAPPAITPDVAGLRVGVPRSYYLDDLDSAVTDAYRGGLARLEAAGARLVDVAVVEEPRIRSLVRLIMRSELSAVHRRRMAANPELYPLAVAKFFTAGEGLLAADYIDALRLRPILTAQALATTYSQVDLLATPTAPVTAPRYDALTDAGDPAIWAAITRLMHMTQPATFFGFPALSVPLATGGPPIGLQLIGPPGAETVLFRAGAALA
ncbi:MAG: amidase [Alphaproteobacteria bacterium]|nr:amidase [Alphaproteobacteria bacterium]